MLPSLLATALFLAPQPPASDPPGEGDLFPALELPLLGEAGLHSLADFRGTKVLLIQFASW